MSKCTVCPNEAYKTIKFSIMTGNAMGIPQKLCGAVEIGLCANCITAGAKSGNVKNVFQIIGGFIMGFGCLAACIASGFDFNTVGMFGAILLIGATIGGIGGGIAGIVNLFKLASIKKDINEYAKYCLETSDNPQTIFAKAVSHKFTYDDGVIFNWTALESKETVSETDFSEPAFLKDIRAPIVIDNNQRFLLDALRADYINYDQLLGLDKNPEYERRIKLAIQKYTQS